MPRSWLWLCCRYGFRLGCFGLAWFAAAIVAAPAQAGEPFPFDTELTLDAAPMHGSKRIPTIQIGEDGTASIDLWCASLKAQATVSDTAITIVPADAQEAQCDPDRQARDADLLGKLAQVTGWRRSGDVVNLIGPALLRFRLMTN